MLTDRLDCVIGEKSAKPLEEHFGIRTVDDLLRHYPRKYSDGHDGARGGRGAPEEGEHVTFVDVITKAEAKWTNRQPQAGVPRRHPRDRRPKVTATFFNAKYLKKQLVKGTRLMLSGEVGYFKGTMQLTHPAFLILDSTSGETGTRSLPRSPKLGASGERAAVGVRARLLPDLPGQREGAELGHLRLRAPGARRARPGRGSAAGTILRQRNLMSEDEALRAIHLAENAAERERARERLTFDEAVGLQWALVARRHGELSETGRRRRARTAACGGAAASGCRSS